MTSPSKQVAKKRGRPAGVKNKTAAKVKPVAKAKVFKQEDVEILLDDLFYEMQSSIDSLESKIKNLEHKAMQYEVVIDYLETKLEIK